jgi:hypothetical protein
MLPFGVTVPATVPQRSEIPEGLMNYPVYRGLKKHVIMFTLAHQELVKKGMKLFPVAVSGPFRSLPSESTALLCYARQFC